MNIEQKSRIVQLPDVEILARTIYGEARGQGLVGMVAVANVVLNRTLLPEKYGYNISGVCLKSKQFSCWNDGDPNLEIIMDPPDDITTARFVAAMAMGGFLIDNTSGSNLYHRADMKNRPYWSTAKDVVMKKQIGDHIFIRRHEYGPNFNHYKHFRDSVRT